MLDRIDIHIEVPRADYEKLSDERLGEPSANVQALVEAAREQQRERFDNRQSAMDNRPSSIICNADIAGSPGPRPNPAALPTGRNL